MQSKKESNEKFYSLFEKLPQGVVYQDAVGRIIEANPTAQMMLGLSLDQLQQRSSIDPRWHAIHPDGTSFPGEDHPAMVSLRTGQPLSGVVMGVFNPSIKNYTWLLINSIPEFRESDPKPFQVFTSFTDITRQVEAEQKLKRQSELMELLVFTSTSFITIPEEKLKETINTALQKLGEFVSADRMYVFDYDWEQHTCSNTYEWCAPGIEAHLEVLQNNSLEGLEDWTEAHKKGEMLYIHDVYSLAEESTLRQFLEPQDIKSLIALPVVDDSGCLGFIGLDSVRKHHIYTKNEITLLKTFAGILANVRNRLDRERQLKERIKELNSIYKVGNLTMRTDIPEGFMLQQILEVIPKGFFDPSVTSVRITLEDKTLVSQGFALSDNLISSPITTDLQEVGKIEVFLPEGKKFLPEEHTLIHAISNSLSQHLEARKSLEIIRKSESRFRNLVNSQTNYILRTDLQGFHTFWNKKFEEDFGYIYSDRGTTEKDSMSSICEYDKDKARRTVIDCVQEPGKVFQVELDKPFETGEIRTTLWDFVCLPDSQGAPLEMQCMGIDISDRKKIEKKLIESERKYRFLFEESPDGYLII